MKPSPEYQVEFLQNLQRLLSEGGFVATYKYALLLALADISVEIGDDSGQPLLLRTRLIAEKFISYYWRQSIPYLHGEDESGKLLKQNTGKQAAILGYVEEAHRVSGGSISSIKADSKAWKILVGKVDRVVRVMPLWKLQTVGNIHLNFLYENKGSGNIILLKPGVVFCLRRFHSLISELVRGAWLRYIRRHNHDVLGTTFDLIEFMFGSERSNLQTVQPILEDIQYGKCFYCKSALNRNSSHIDHFIPWSKYPVDLGHNFVLCHNSCNSSKSDHIASTEHLHAWIERNVKYGEELGQEFGNKQIMHNVYVSVQIARWAYSQIEVLKGLTWVRKKELVPLDEDWKGIISVFDTRHKSHSYGSSMDSFQAEKVADPSFNR
jgi:5-methylcytosine-specific restriction endonuclease McrA